MGRCVYGGIYDPGNSLSDEDGFRKDVIEAIKSLDVPVIRYPGGNFCATYHWMDGIGPKEKRPTRPELAWLGIESNQFGTDEFMKWCKIVGTEPYICLNMGTGTLDEAMAWVEYCNGTKDTFYANLRRKNGHEEPYNVKYWALGNEIWGPWQVNQMTKENYALAAHQWAKALKLLDPKIQLILCGETGHSSWDHHVLQNAIQFVDMHSIHIYTASNAHLPNVTAPLCAERSIEMAASMIDLARIEAKVPPSAPRQTICFDEWNVWDPVRAPGEQGAEEQYTISDALAVAVWLNVFVRQSKYLGMANIAQSVNVISPLMTSKDGLRKQTIWWPLYLFSKYMRGTTLGAHLRCGEYDGVTEPKWIRDILQTPWLDVSCVLGDDGFVNLAVVNIKEDADVRVRLVGVGEGNVQTFVVTGENVNAKTVEKEDSTGYREGTWQAKEGTFVFERHSLTLLRSKP
ncbi:MAG: hypothetical protein Q9160_005567 [Pyrenula sp. 1 TL-2023]